MDVFASYQPYLCRKPSQIYLLESVLFSQQSIIPEKLHNQDLNTSPMSQLQPEFKTRIDLKPHCYVKKITIINKSTIILTLVLWNIAFL